MQRATKEQCETFAATLTRLAPEASIYTAVSVARRIMRMGATYGRLQEAQCNGDWPADNGERNTLPCGGAEDKGCGSYWHPSTLRGPARKCPDCRAQDSLRRICAEIGAVADFQGDPRGHTVKVKIAGSEIGVPTS